MSNLILNISLLLAQTEQEKKLTMLYVGLFVFLLMMLIVDSRGSQKWISNKTLKWITITFFIIAVIVLIILYFVL